MLLYEGVIYSALLLCSACEAAICFTYSADERVIHSPFHRTFSYFLQWFLLNAIQCALNLKLACHELKKKAQVNVKLSPECLKHNLYDQR